jgi:O-antigen ligase
MINSKYLDKLLFVLYVIFFVSTVCCFRAITSIVIPVILVAGIYKNKAEHGSFFNPHLKNYFFLSCCLYYLIQVIVLLNAHHDPGKLILLKSAIVFVPAMICCSNYPGTNNYRKLMNVYVWIMTGAVFFCLAVACYKYIFQHAGTSIFLYHALVSPLKQHAIQVSILVFIALVYLLETAKKAMYIANKAVHFLFIVFLTSAILLLSSKLVIVVTALCFVYYFFLFLKTAVRIRFISVLVLFTAITMIGLVLFTQNQVSKRFNEIIETNMDLVSQRDFNPGVYFNGLQFRLLQWRFTKEILTEKNAWFTGVADDSQKLLDEKYISSHMYTGDGKYAPDHGYLGYNTHNQFLESLLQTGFLGIGSFILVFLSLIFLAFRGKRRVLSFVILLLLAYSLNEALLERQYSIVIFTFFPLLFYYGGRVKVRSSGQ